MTSVNKGINRTMFQFNDEFNVIDNTDFQLRIIEKYPGDSEVIPYYYYYIIRKSDNMKVGKISIRIGNNFHSYYNGHIGYEIAPEFRGNNYAYKASLMVLDVAKFHGMDFIYICCDQDNVASYKTIERLGAELVEICQVPKNYFAYKEGMKKQRIYKLTLK